VSKVSKKDLAKLRRLAKKPEHFPQALELARALASDEAWEALVAGISLGKRSSNGFLTANARVMQLIAEIPEGERASIDTLRRTIDKLVVRSSAFPLGGATHLEELTLSVRGATDLSALPALRELHSLYLQSGHVPDPSPLGEAPSLRSLQIRCQLAALPAMPALEELRLDAGAKGPTRLGSLPSLRTLLAYRAEGLVDVSGLADSKALEDVRMTLVSKLDDITPFARPTLKHLDLEDLAAPDIDALAACEALETLRLHGMRAARFEDLSALAKLPRLRRIELTGVTTLVDVSALATLPSLEILDLRDCTALESLDALEGAPKLRALALSITRTSPKTIPPALLPHATWAMRPLLDDFAAR